MSKQETSKKANFSFLRVILLASFLIFMGYKFFYEENSGENFEQGRVLYTEAKVDFEQQNYPAAIQKLNDALTNDFLPANGLLGEIHLKMHDYKAALHYLKSALSVENGTQYEPNFYGWVNYNLGMSYYLERNGNIAYKYFKEAHDLGYQPAEEFVKKLARKEDRLPKG